MEITDAVADSQNAFCKEPAPAATSLDVSMFFLMPHGKSGCNLAGLYCLPWLFYYGGMSRTYGPRPWKVDLPLHECMGLQVEQTIRDSLTKMTWNRSKLCLVRIAFPFFPGYKTLRRVVPLSIAGARPPTSLKRLVN